MIPLRSAAPAAAQARNEVTLGAGVLPSEVAYARCVGVGAWIAFEPPSWFAENVREPLGASLFVRMLGRGR